jgi:hypothetical protein
VPTSSTRPISPLPVARAHVPDSRRVVTACANPVSSGVAPMATSVPMATPTRVIDSRKQTWKAACDTPAAQTARLRSAATSPPRRETARASHSSVIAIASRTSVIADALASSGPRARAVPMVPNKLAPAHTSSAEPPVLVTAPDRLVTSGRRPVEHRAPGVGPPDGTPPPARSRSTDRSASSRLAAPVTTAAASSPFAPEEAAIATARARADSRNDGSSTAAAVYVRPSRSRTAAPSGAAVRARVERARITSLRSSASVGCTRHATCLWQRGHRGRRSDALPWRNLHFPGAAAPQGCRFRSPPCENSGGVRPPSWTHGRRRAGRWRGRAGR